MRTLGYVILGLLCRAPRTGYDLARAMDRPIGFMWTAGHSQIYPELAALEAAGLVRHTVVDGRGPRDTKRYSITAKGRRAVDEWTDSPMGPEPARSELMIRVRNFWLISPQRTIAFLDGVRLDHEAKLATYLDEERDFAENVPGYTDVSTPEFAAYATLRSGLSYERHVIEWCDWLRAQIASTLPTDQAR